LIAKGDVLWCNACQSSINAEERHAPRHCFGSQNNDARKAQFALSLAEQSRTRHRKKVQKLAAVDAHKGAIMSFINIAREDAQRKDKLRTEVVGVVVGAA
jgi:hypothetical protein